MVWRLVAAAVTGYLIGGVDFAVIVGRLRGVDIYQVGSGNPGTSNVLRTMGKGAAAAVLAGDLLKGVVAAAMGAVLSGGGDGVFAFESVAGLAGLAAVAGHCYPALHKFRGGKGVATAAGVVLWLDPLVGLGLGLLWALLVWTTRTASIASLAAVVLVLPVLWLGGTTGWPLGWVGAIMTLVVWRHKPNIERMLGGGDRKVVVR